MSDKRQITGHGLIGRELGLGMLFTPKVFALCIALAIGPPIVMVAMHYREWLVPKPVDPRFATGEVWFFESNSCGACRAMKPTVAKLKSEGFMIRTMDTSQEKAAQKAMAFGIRAIPTFVLMRDGEEVRRAVGVVSDEDLRQLWR
jgi:thiol-disulfide isomerase/thioredoxin